MVLHFNEGIGTQRQVFRRASLERTYLLLYGKKVLITDVLFWLDELSFRQEFISLIVYRAILIISPSCSYLDL